eukprot:scaffold7758_cov160-Skeletonema_marinoi.AAC.3
MVQQCCHVLAMHNRFVWSAGAPDRGTLTDGIIEWIVERSQIRAVTFLLKRCKTSFLNSKGAIAPMGSNAK